MCCAAHSSRYLSDGLHGPDPAWSGRPVPLLPGDPLEKIRTVEPMPKQESISMRKIRGRAKKTRKRRDMPLRSEPRADIPTDEDMTESSSQQETGNGE